MIESFFFYCPTTDLYQVVLNVYPSVPLDLQDFVAVVIAVLLLPFVPVLFFEIP